jgi:hypothetical protein
MIKYDLFPTLVAAFEYDKKNEFRNFFEKNYMKHCHYNENGFLVTGEIEGYNKVHFEPDFEPFFDFVMKCCAEYLTELSINLDNYYLVLAKAWFSFIDGAGNVLPHTHADHHLSFTYYVDLPEDICKIFQVTDRRQNLNEPTHGSFTRLGAVPNVKENNIYNTNDYFFDLKEGQLIVFPSKLSHWTPQQNLQTESVRKCVAGDLLLVYKDTNNKKPYGMYTPDMWKYYNVT